MQRFERTGDKEGRNAANEPNRRVLAFLFKPGTRIVPAKWPCPSVKQKTPENTCKDRLWKDSDKRLAPDPTPDEKNAKDRAFKETADTFGCRFYHGFGQNSPCEGTLKLWVLRIGIDDDIKKDAQGKEVEDEKGRTTLSHPLARKRYICEVSKDPGAPIIRGRTDEKGGIRLPVFDERTTMSLKLDAKSLLDPQDTKARKEAEAETDEQEFIELVLRGGDLLPLLEFSDAGFDRKSAFQRVSNLGYGPAEPIDKWKEEDEKEAIAAFQRKHKLEETGDLNEPTVQVIRKVHGS